MTDSPSLHDHYRSTLPTATQRCDDCRDEVPFTDLRDCGGWGRLCGACCGVGRDRRVQS